MLCKKAFMQAYGLLLTGKGVALDKTAARLTYKAFKNDFTDDEFRSVCMQIFKTENFYGRVPDASLFSKHAPKNNKTEDFISRCYEYLESAYISRENKRSFLDALSESEKRALDARGGISHLWSLCRQQGVYSSDKAECVLEKIRKSLETQATRSPLLIEVERGKNDDV